MDLVVSEPHFADHALPVYLALPPELQGTIYTGRGKPANALTAKRVAAAGLEPTRTEVPPGSGGLTLVAAVGDLTRTNRAAPRRRFAYMEHGCGISYGGNRASYIGGTRRPACEVIFTPNEWTAERQREATPWIDVVSLGSSPRLDRWVGVPAPEGEPVVAISFHADLKGVCPEAGSALRYYAKHLHRLVGGPWKVIGHGHPRIHGVAEIAFRRAGIPFEPDFERVMEIASVYCVDNSSSLFEVAALDRPVVALNCPLYRRNVNHGLRFWDHIPGVQCDDPRDLCDVIGQALVDPPEFAEMRRSAVSHVYPRNDGGASQRAAEVIAGLPQADPVPVGRVSSMFEVIDREGVPVKRYRTEYEARTHARKLRGAYQVVAG